MAQAHVRSVRRLQAPASRPRPGRDVRLGQSLDSVVQDEGRARAQFILYRLLKRARQHNLGLPPLTSTRYINTISPEQEPEFPGDEQMELRIRRMIRWNAVAMVIRANSRAPGIGGHLATYASGRHAVRGRLQPLLPRQGRGSDGRPDLLPGPRRAGHLRPRLPRGPPQSKTSSTTSARRFSRVRA